MENMARFKWAILIQINGKWMQTLRGFSFPTYLQLIPTHFRRGSKIAFTCKLKVIQLAPSFTNINIFTAFPLLQNICLLTLLNKMYI